MGIGPAEGAEVLRQANEHGPWAVAGVIVGVVLTFLSMKTIKVPTAAGIDLTYYSDWMAYRVTNYAELAPSFIIAGAICGLLGYGLGNLVKLLTAKQPAS